jgi:hypothetical protein
MSWYESLKRRTSGKALQNWILHIHTRLLRTSNLVFSVWWTIGNAARHSALANIDVIVCEQFLAQYKSVQIPTIHDIHENKRHLAHIYDIRMSFRVGEYACTCWYHHLVIIVPYDPNAFWCQESGLRVRPLWNLTHNFLYVYEAEHVAATTQIKVA